MRHLRLDTVAPDDVAASLARLRAELDLPAGFSPEVTAEAERTAERVATALAGPVPDGVADLRAMAFVTIDPPGSMDLDQALHLSREDDGYVLHYAIADVGRLVEPGSALDAETRARATTVYGPDERIPLHPAVLSEGVGSLLPDVDRFALVWQIALDTGGKIADATVRRSLVRSRARLTYAEVQEGIDAGEASPLLTAHPMLALLPVVGGLREERERARGGVSLDVPEQEIEADDEGGLRLAFRSVLPVEGWNAQLSLATGIAAAQVMRRGGVGVLRTLPPAEERDVARLRRAAHGLGIDWPRDSSYAELLETLDSRVAAHAAFMTEAMSLFRGSGYLAFVEAVEASDATRHAAIAAEYAHVTAPLRRLVDRFGLEICVALCAGEPVPSWVLDAMPELGAQMASGSQRASSYERGCLDIVEAAVLRGREGEEFDAVVVDTNGSASSGVVMLAQPAVRGRVTGAEVPLGEDVRVRLVRASVEDRAVEFALV